MGWGKRILMGRALGKWLLEDQRHGIILLKWIKGM
jgi:hypothetical protein